MIDSSFQDQDILLHLLYVTGEFRADAEIELSRFQPFPLFKPILAGAFFYRWHGAISVV